MVMTPLARRYKKGQATNLSPACVITAKLASSHVGNDFYCRKSAGAVKMMTAYVKYRGHSHLSINLAKGKEPGMYPGYSNKI